MSAVGEALDIVAIGARTPVGITAEESGVGPCRDLPVCQCHFSLKSGHIVRLEWNGEA